jgi:hypothetical protein
VALVSKIVVVGQAKILPIGDSALVVEEAGLGIYATNGIAVTPSDFGLRGLDFVLPVCASAGYTIAWDRPNLKILVFQTAAGAGQHAEVGNGVDLSAVKVHLIAIGKR